MGRKRGVVSKTDPVNQPRKHAAFLLLAELGIENAPDGQPIGIDTNRVVLTLRSAGYTWDQDTKEWRKFHAPRGPLENRFWPHVDKRGPDDCWEWVNGSFYRHPTNGTDTYGCISFNGKRQGAHRASWYLHHGEIPEGMQVLHTCDNTKCVNPKHLFLGTHQDNMNDKAAKGRSGPRPIRGERHGRHKLTEGDVREIIRERRARVPRKVVADKYGVCEGTIAHIDSGKIWRWIPRD